ncbi:CoA transferase, partial [Microbacterium sp. zg.Y909]|uniref:CoA transferase n=1 Tax=Microbacterium sp. zg.Y909 TaxID=2969413 RepID=UPI0027D7BE34
MALEATSRARGSFALPFHCVLYRLYLLSEEEHAMTTTTPPAGALEGLRILDLGGEIANYCGRLFAQLGADVILVEPPSGSSYRTAPPLA